MYQFKLSNGTTSNKAYMDGYQVAERLLEGVVFAIEVGAKGKVTATLKDPTDQKYMDGIAKKWFKEVALYAKSYLEEGDFEMLEPDIAGDVYVDGLVDANGADVDYNSLSSKTPKAPKPAKVPVAIKVSSLSDILSSIQNGTGKKGGGKFGA